MRACSFEPGRNLGASERDRRLRKGVIGAAIGLIVAVVLVESDLAWTWRLLLFLPFSWSTNMIVMGLLGT
jgi:hypothetical protein